MSLFRRTPATESSHPITYFWRWWMERGRAISPHERSPLSGELARRVAAIHPDLDWHFGPGESSAHRLTVSAGGNAELRPIAERWRRAAPAADDVWEYRSSQARDAHAVNQQLELASGRVDLSTTTFSVRSDDDRLRVDLGVYNSAFGELTGDDPYRVVFLLLDWLLGEDDVERWVGGVEVLTSPPEHPVDGDAVLRAVAAVADRADPDQWSVGTWEDRKGRPHLASFRLALRWIDHPTFDRHYALHVRYAARRDGLPKDLTALRAPEDELESALGTGGLLVGHETGSGTRTFHVYADSEDQNVDDRIVRWAKSSHVGVEVSQDPAWREVRHFLR
ncbi:MAG: DUF695 domain-containing protein [Microbacterium sp.]|uniref:DUF695 domain-containing protein n=1 Tax=Microbacterium sp. TaxID=51671 RepID=UPI001AD53458|nr:DUF695 domain-containing protein [Microbacterium sp.]MBN9153350.1 DUF695 domain-containing protein [Microbacterium sp.]MBN9170467.1 DUF695 domain-containing protein [Microbacterium sp.]MBN9173334.1 DUF695 domain-containing protein [Microbacterium sp.]